VPDLFWRQEPGVELSDKNPAHVRKAFDLYYDFDYDLAVRDMEDTRAFLRQMPACDGKVGAVGYCLGGKLCYLMCCRTDIDCAVAYYGTYIEHNIREARNLHRPSCCTWRCAIAGCRPRSMICWSEGSRQIRSSPFTNIPTPITLRTARRQDLQQAGGGPCARALARLLPPASRLTSIGLQILGDLDLLRQRSAAVEKSMNF